MTVLDCYGLAGIIAISLSFLTVRKIARYLLVCAVVIVAFGWATQDFLLRTPAQWIVMCAGLCLAVFGLLIVRVMLIRSVSLHLLGRLHAPLNDEFTRDISSRLDDMRGAGLIRDVEGTKVTLTGRGQFVGSIVSVLYTVFRIKG